MPVPRIRHKDRFKIHFVTITVIDWVDIFTNDRYFEILANSFEHCTKNKGLEPFEYVFMTNHIHFIAAADESKDGLSAIVRDFKRFTTEEVHYRLKKDNRNYLIPVLTSSADKKPENDFQLWQETNYPEIIFTEDFLNSKIRYIWYNPVKKGYVLNPEDWKWGSARQKLLQLEPNHPDIMLPCKNWD